MKRNTTPHRSLLASVAVVLATLFLAACGSPDGNPPAAGGNDTGDGGCSLPGYDPGDPSSNPTPTPEGEDCEDPDDPAVIDPDSPEAPVGCGPGPTPDGFVSWEECPDGGDTGPRYQLVEQRDGLVDPRPVDWLKAKPRSGGTVLRVTFWSGVEECYGVSDVEVEETDTSVTVTIREGRVPEAEVCIEVAVKKAIDVGLSEPVGGRDIVDGAE